MKTSSLSFKGLIIVILSLIFTVGAMNYVGAVTYSSPDSTNLSSSIAASIAKKKKKVSCKAGSKPSLNKSKCIVCKAGSASENGKSCLACTGDTIASEKGANACTPCPTGTKANTEHSACIKQRYVSGEKK